MQKIIDSALTLEEALRGATNVPKEIRDTLTLLDIEYVSFDGMLHQGQLVVHQEIARELKEIFEALRDLKFPIMKAVPIVEYNWLDEPSMADNNTSAFNYRLVYATNELSNHSYGLAVDINPAINPYMAIDGTIFPSGAVYDPTKPGTLLIGDRVVELFESKGWEWGGKWKGKKDWQHFQKVK